MRVMFGYELYILFISKLENAWQSLAYSPLGTVVSPSSEYLWKTLTYWSPECLKAPSHCEHRWTKLGNNYRLRLYIFLPKTPGWLIRISPNFHKMYRNDCQLSCWNQNCDIPIRFRTPVCQMNENRPISAESQHNFYFLPHFNSKTTEPIFTIFYRNVEQLVALLMHVSARR